METEVDRDPEQHRDRIEEERKRYGQGDTRHLHPQHAHVRPGDHPDHRSHCEKLGDDQVDGVRAKEVPIFISVKRVTSGASLLQREPAGEDVSGATIRAASPDRAAGGDQEPAQA